MDRIDFSRAGGAPIDQEGLDFMQKCYTDVLKAIASLVGDKVIITGMIEGSGSVSDGWFAYNGEPIKFNASGINTKVKIDEVAIDMIYNDGLTKSLYYNKVAVCDATGDFDYADFDRMETLISTSNLAKTLQTNLTSLQASYDAHTHAWSAITGKPAGFITYVGTKDVGDVGTVSGASDTILTVSIPNQTDSNYIVAGSLVGFNTDLNYDNDVSWVIGNKTDSSFQIALREYETAAQNLKFQYAIIKTA